MIWLTPALGWTIDGAVAINDSGEIAAEAYQQGGDYHAVLLTPITTPEPPSLCLVGVAALGLIAIRCGARL